jgi:hypothetical protein
MQRSCDRTASRCFFASDRSLPAMAAAVSRVFCARRASPGQRAGLGEAQTRAKRSWQPATSRARKDPGAARRVKRQRSATRRRPRAWRAKTHLEVHAQVGAARLHALLRVSRSPRVLDHFGGASRKGRGPSSPRPRRPRCSDGATHGVCLQHDARLIILREVVHAWHCTDDASPMLLCSYSCFCSAPFLPRSSAQASASCAARAAS